jgi:RimJ/RimL family protein N-acetyltransferase
LKNSSVLDAKIVRLSAQKLSGGNMCWVQNGQAQPFAVKRAYYTYDIPGGVSRGSHAHRQLKQLIVAANGSFNIQLDDGHLKREIQLARPHYGLYLPPGLWRNIANFSNGAICLVLASAVYTEKDYIRDYPKFLAYKKLQLVAFSRTFLEHSYHWLKDPEIKALTMAPDFSREQQEHFYETLPSREDYWIKGINYEDRPAGACGLRQIDKQKQEAEYFAYLGDKSLWDKKLGPEIFEQTLVETQDINLKKVYVWVHAQNPRALKHFANLGFKQKGKGEEKVLLDYAL